MEILAEIMSSCLVWYPEAAVITFDGEASLGQRILAGIVFTFGSAGMIAIAGLLGYIVFHGV